MNLSLNDMIDAREKRNISIILICISFLSIIFIALDKPYLSLALFSVPYILFSLFYFHKYGAYFFIGSLFIWFYFYWPLRIQLAEFSVVIFFIFYLTNKDSQYFNTFAIPNSVKVSALLLILSVFISSIRTPHLSYLSVYFAFLFLIFMLSSFLIFKSVINSTSVYKYLNFFSRLTAVSCLIIFIQILQGGIETRWTGIAGSAIMDFTIIASLILFTEIFLKDSVSYGKLLLLIIVSFGMIALQSRFVWLGFILSLVYGILIIFLTNKNFTQIFIKKVLLLGLVVAIFISFFIASGFEDAINKRVSEIDTSVLQEGEEREVISNSLDTRVLIWLVALNTFLKNPVTGVGYQMFFEVSEKYNVLPEALYYSFVKDLDAHTTYFNFLSETGIIGFVSFVLYLLIVFKLSFKSIKISTDPLEKRVSLMLNILIFFIITYSTFSGAFTFGQNAFSMHFIIGLVVGNYVYLKNKNLSNPKKVLGVI